MGTQRYKDSRNDVFINTGTSIIKPVENERLLGLNIHQSLKWKDHILENKRSLIKTLRGRLAALKRISSLASFKTRCMFANSCLMSVLVTMLPVYGGTEAYLIRALQVIQNHAARCVTRLSWFTPTRALLLQCNWLSIKQLTFYHSVLQVWRIASSKMPLYLHAKLEVSNTRSGAIGNFQIPLVNRSISRNSFMVRGIAAWNATPPSIRSLSNIDTLKKRLKEWVKENVEIG